MTRTPSRFVAMTVAVLAIAAVPSAHSSRITSELVTSDSRFADSPRLNVVLNVTEVTVTNSIADATLAVEVQNEESDAITNVWVIFEDGTEVSVGDVSPEGSASSSAASYTFDLSGKVPSANVALPVTVKFSLQGSPTEKQTVTFLRLLQ